jgi:hypothetical protein
MTHTSTSSQKIDMPQTDQLPLESQCVEFPLTEEQVAILRPLLVLQRMHDRSVIFCVPAQSYDAAVKRDGCACNFKVVERQAARKALAILRKAEIEPAD